MLKLAQEQLTSLGAQLEQEVALASWARFKDTEFDLILDKKVTDKCGQMFCIDLVRHGIDEYESMAKLIKRLLSEREELEFNQLEKCIVFDNKMSFFVKESLLNHLGNTGELHLTELGHW